MSDTTPAPVHDEATSVDDGLDDGLDDATGAYEHAAESESERDESTFALFEGDEGRLDEPQRRALVALLRHPYVSARTHTDEWRAVLDAEHQLRSRLNDLFLELHVDRDREVAFKRQARSESTRRGFPTLLRDLPYTREETIVLVYLRMRLRADARPGPDQVVVDRFRNGDPSNDAPVAHDSLAREANYQGGDLQGVLDALRAGYFDSLGVNVLWLSPVVDNPPVAEREFPDEFDA